MAWEGQSNCNSGFADSKQSLWQSDSLRSSGYLLLVRHTHWPDSQAATSQAVPLQCDCLPRAVSS